MKSWLCVRPSVYLGAFGLVVVSVALLLYAAEPARPFELWLSLQARAMGGDPDLATMFLVTDLLTGLAYLGIAVLLALFMGCVRAELPHKGMLLALSITMLAGGLSQLSHLWVMWQPAYWIEGLLRACTAAIAVATTLTLPAYWSRVVALVESARLERERQRQLEQLNTVLSQELQERRRIELALRESEQRFFEAFTHASIGMALVALDGSFRQVNRALCEIMGYGEEELLATDFQTITHPDDLEADLSQLHRLLAGEIGWYQMEKRYRHREGHYLWGLLSVSLVRDSAGEPLYFVGQVQNIDAQKRAEAALRETAANLSLAQQIAHVGSWSLALGSGEIFWSDELYRMLGYEPRSVDPRQLDLAMLAHPDDSALMREVLEATTTTHMPFMGEIRVVRADGAIRTMLVQTETIYDEQGRPWRNIGTVLDITERKTLEAQLIHQAFHDPLTGLPNRALFLDRLHHALARRREAHQEVAVLFLDLDRFKIVNDSLGHACGDDLLRLAAQRIQACVRPSDTVARLGGDEFTVLLDDVSHASVATAVAERIIDALASPFTIKGAEVFTGTSIGIAMSSDQLRDPHALLQAADIAMYQAKSSGRSRYALFDPALSVEVQQRLELETALRHATERDELRLHYQPIVDLQSGAIVGVEALVRWRHPEHGLLSPATFVPVAEESGAILEIGRWVLRRACEDVGRWQRKHPDAAALVLCVNLSARQFQSPGLVDELSQILRETGFAADRLKLEITESVAMHDAETTIVTLHALRELGVQLAIDDFGTGYSSLAYLRRFPINTVKIDRSFVSNVTSDPNDAAITAAIIAMAQRLHLRVVAEGIEMREQWAFLRAHQCLEGQGYLFSPPLAADDLVALLEQGGCIVPHVARAPDLTVAASVDHATLVSSPAAA